MDNRTRSVGATTSGPISLLRHVKWEHLVAGMSGGVVATLVLHPLDLVKIRFQGKCNMLYIYRIVVYMFLFQYPTVTILLMLSILFNHQCGQNLDSVSGIMKIKNIHDPEIDSL